MYFRVTKVEHKTTVITIPDPSHKTTVAVITISDATVPHPPPTVITPYTTQSSKFYRILSAAPQKMFILITFTYTWFVSMIIQFTRKIW